MVYTLPYRMYIYFVDRALRIQLEKKHPIIIILFLRLKVATDYHLTELELVFFSAEEYLE